MPTAAGPAPGTYHREATSKVTGVGCLVWSVCGLSGWLGLFIVLPGEGPGVIRFTRSGFDVVRVGG